MKLIALCGPPGAGKTEVQRILIGYGYSLIDDGEILREISKIAFRLTDTDVMTQEGKRSEVSVGQIRYSVRNILGKIGLALEHEFGPSIIPLLTLNKLDNKGKYCLGSVRRQQGVAYTQSGGEVWEITRPGYNIVNDFDNYNKECIARTISNDGSLFDLRKKVLQELKVFEKLCQN